ncbi:type II toxin-antitoxin system antitoxin DNA ADP-ribosyl glycohydrolase DarG [Grimontia sp. NTOU-MAR1]|uniref:type II toxin-antitoxin system antitoxin DNA ADP-ribosyl glycohydrolase DarG n=1 Tax=Grimontia sp. NTOU-MAR1 TaxID=3111011 RepID=UPI002DBF4FC2|nr:macro domain-containing protein [Grimontia sp. NTOU-MAR1]WRV96255.1 macro domain-containing protein [Grimontia sp. NTOU-MAR1]
MIKYVQGDLFADDAEAIINTVNTVGVMGKGLAYQFKEKYPENFDAYRDACKRNQVVTGKMFIFETKSLKKPRIIINFPTKEHWRGKSKIEYIESGLEDLVKIAIDAELKSVAIPALGAGLGGLPWSQVEQKIINKLSPINGIEWRIYAPNEEPKKPVNVHMTVSRATVLYAVSTYLQKTKKQEVTEQALHCFLYLLDKRGLGIDGLTFNKFKDAPYSDGLHTYLVKIDGSSIYMSGEQKAANRNSITLNKDILKDLFSKYVIPQKSKKLILDVIDSISGYETLDGLTVLATSLWVITEQPCDSTEIVSKDLPVELISESLTTTGTCSKAMIRGAIQRLKEEKWLQ